MSTEAGGEVGAVERALDLALIVVKNGGSTTEADRAFRNILTGSGIAGVVAVWRMDFVAVNVTRGCNTASLLRPVGAVGVNAGRASAAVLLGERVAAGEIPVDALPAEMDRLSAIASPYGRWILVAGAALTAAFFSRIAGGDPGAFWIASVAAGVGQFARGWLQSKRLSAASVTLLSGILSSTLASVSLRLSLSGTAPATMVSAVVYMVPGVPLINGFIDMISHRHIFIGLERIANAAFLFLVLAISIAFAYAVVM
jgi:uncharacterized membrane protein YjjP (DUF1212 family)